jgi:hypothetical protein
MNIPGPRRAAGFFKARSGAFQAGVGLVGPITAIVSTLLALGLISPFGGEDAIAKSVEKTKDASTSAVSIAVTVRAPANGGEPISYTGEGTFDHETGFGHLFLDFSATHGLEGASNVETILRHRLVYFRGTPGADVVGAGGTWLRVDLVEVADRLAKLREIGAQGAASVDLSALAEVDFPDPSTALDFLDDSSDLESAGQRTILGRDTRLFNGTLNRGSSHRRLSVWIDEDDLVRRVRITGGPEGLAFTIGFRQFGVDVDARAPRGRNVRDALDLLDG